EAPTLVKSDPLAGRGLDGKYELIDMLGEGGMGAVYRARRVHIGDEVAVKVLHPKFVTDGAATERFRREARAAAQLHHPNIVTIHDYGEARGGDTIAYIVMELLSGASLRELLKREGRFTTARAVALMRDICAGVGAAHRRHIVHRDIKPDNIITLAPDADRERETVKVVDFGIAKLRDLASENTLTQTGAVVGTPYYMSPEQCRGESLDARADVYSLGALLYEMLAGTPPFSAPSVTGVIAKHLTEAPPPLPANLNVPPALEAVVMRALSKDPQARQADAADFAREIGAAFDGRQVMTATAVTDSAKTAPDDKRADAQTNAPAPLFPSAPQPVVVTPIPTPLTHNAPSQTHNPTPQASNPARVNSAPIASPSYDQTAPPPSQHPVKRRSRAPLVIGLFMLLLLMVGGVGFGAFLFFRQWGTVRRAGGNNQNSTRNVNSAPTPDGGATKADVVAVSPAMGRAEQKLLSSTLLTTDDLTTLTPTELRLLRNSVFARYGRGFDTPELKRYFQSRPWYKERADFNEVQLTDADRANAELIKAFENGNAGAKPDSSATLKDVRATLDAWADSTRDRDLDAHMSHYADTLQTYYLKQGVNSAQLRSERARAFQRYDEMDVKLDHIGIKPDATGTRAVVTFDKTWEFVADDKRSSGSVKQMLWLAKTGDRWLITGEKDLEVHYTNSEETP
ncbi:MAG: protein kinase, partial [Pyrinomonadaceae bacterium]